VCVVVQKLRLVVMICGVEVEYAVHTFGGIVSLVC